MKIIGWTDYDNCFPIAENTDEEIEALIKEIREKGFKFGGDAHENHSCCAPVLSNGKIMHFSWREWGGIMARAWNLQTKEGKYNYILWYMDEYGPEKQVYPDLIKDGLNYSLLDSLTHLNFDVDEQFMTMLKGKQAYSVIPEQFTPNIKITRDSIITFKHNENIVTFEMPKCIFISLSLLEEFGIDLCQYSNKNINEIKEILIKKYPYINKENPNIILLQSY